MKTTLKTLGKLKACANHESESNGVKTRFKMTTKGVMVWRKGSRIRYMVQFPQLAGFVALGRSVDELKAALDGQLPLL